MAWFKVDDGFPDHDKARMAGMLGRALWGDVGPRCAKARTDGIVAAHRVDEYLYLSGVKGKREGNRTALQALVRSGLWHDHDDIEGCERCRRITGGLASGAFYFHDWTDYQPTKDDQASPETKKIAARKKALHRNDELRDEIYGRDHGRCRFCGITVDPNPQNKRGRNGLTYDHLDPGCFDPNGGNFYDPTGQTGVVLACRGCNSAKKNRTVDEWIAAGGRPLLPVMVRRAGSGLDVPAWLAASGGPAEAEPDPDPAGSEPAADLRGDGSGLAGSGTGSGTGSGPGSGSDLTRVTDDDDDTDDTGGGGGADAA